MPSKPVRTLDDTVTEHDRKAFPDPRATGDPSSPQGWFWHPEDAGRDEAFHNLHVPELEETSGRSEARAPGAIAPNRWDAKAQAPDPDDLADEGLPKRRSDAH